MSPHFWGAGSVLVRLWEEGQRRQLSFIRVPEILKNGYDGKTSVNSVHIANIRYPELDSLHNHSWDFEAESDMVVNIESIQP